MMYNADYISGNRDCQSVWNKICRQILNRMAPTWHWESRIRRACEREQESGKQCKAILQERVGKLSVPSIQRLDVGQLLEAKPIKIVLCGLVDAKTVSGCSVTSTQASRSAPTPMLHARCRKAPRRRWAVSWRRSCENTERRRGYHAYPLRCSLPIPPCGSSRMFQGKRRGCTKNCVEMEHYCGGTGWTVLGRSDSTCCT